MTPWSSHPRGSITRTLCPYRVILTPDRTRRTSQSTHPASMILIRTFRSFLSASLLLLATRLLGQELVFDSPTAARELLGKRDPFIERLSPFDRAARMKTNGPVDEATFLRFVADSVVEWKPAEIERIRAGFDLIREGLQKTGAPLPPVIHFIQTTGREEGNAPYTRGNAIIVPSGTVRRPSTQLTGMLAHEVFHVLSRSNPALRDRLYAAIGFEPCGEVRHPATLADRRITNPDAPINAHAIEVSMNGERMHGVPILFSTSPTYDAERGGEFFAYLKFELLLVERTSNGGHRVLSDAAGPRWVPIEKVTGFHEKIGRNTGYILHPEEVLADNFALMVQGVSDVKSPEILDRIRAAIAK